MRINRVPKRLWNKTLREIQDELRLGKNPTVKSANLARVHKAPAPAKSALKRSPVKLTKTTSTYMLGTAASPVRQPPPKKLPTLSPTKSLYPTISEAPILRSPSSAARDRVEILSGAPQLSTATRSRAGVRATKAASTNTPVVTSASTTTTTTAQAAAPKVVKKSASNSSLTGAKKKTAAPRPASAAGSTTSTGRRVGRPPKVKASTEPASTTTSTSEQPAARRPITRNLRSRA